MKRPPPASTTFTALPPPELLAPHHDWIERIRLCYGVEHVRFNHEVLRLIERFAAYVHLLPATPDESFSAPGGLLQLGLQTAFYSLQGSDAQIFSGRASVSARHHLEPRWRLAALIAGLCAETHRPLGQMHVSTPHGERWPAAQMLLQLAQEKALLYQKVGSFRAVASHLEELERQLRTSLPQQVMDMLGQQAAYQSL